MKHWLGNRWYMPGRCSGGFVPRVLLVTVAFAMLLGVQACRPSARDDTATPPPTPTAIEPAPVESPADAEAAPSPPDPPRSEREEDYESLGMMLIEFGDAWEARDTDKAKAMLTENFGEDSPDSVPLPDILEMFQSPEGWAIWIDVMDARIDVEEERASAYPIRAGDPSFALPPVRMDFVKRDGQWKIAAFVPDSIDTKSAEDIRGDLETPELQY